LVGSIVSAQTVVPEGARASFVQPLALTYCYFEDEPQRQMSMRRLSKHEASRPEVNFACRTCSMGHWRSPLRSHVGPMRLVPVGLDTGKHQRL